MLNSKKPVILYTRTDITGFLYEYLMVNFTNYKNYKLSFTFSQQYFCKIIFLFPLFDWLGTPFLTQYYPLGTRFDLFRYLQI